MRSSLFALFVGLIITLGCMTSCKDNSATKNSLIKNIPTSAYAVLETQDIQQLLEATTDNEYLSKLTDLHQLEDLKNQFSKLLQNLRANEIQLKLNNAVSFSIHKTGSKQSDLLFTTQISPNDFELEETIKKLSKFTRVQTRHYDENLIYSINSEGLRFYFAYVDGFLFLTKNSGLLSDAMRQCRAEHNLLDNLTFAEVYKTANQKDILNVFVHVDGLKKALSPHSTVPFRDIRNFSDWMALDLSLGENYLLFNGVSQTKDSLNSVYNYFKDQKAHQPELFDIAPANVEFLMSYHFDSFDKFFRNKQQQLKRKGKLLRLEKAMSQIPINEELIKQNLDEEFAYLMVGKKMTQENQMGIAKINEPYIFESLLSPISDSLENYRDYPIFQMKHSPLVEYLFGADFKSFKAPFWTIIDHYWVLAISKANLRSNINEFLLDHNLANQDNFKKLKENLSSTSNIWMYGAALGNKSHFNQLLQKEDLPKWQKSITQLDYFEGWMLQMDHAHSYFNVNITTKLKEERAQSIVRSEWTLNMDNPISKPAQKVWNHKSKEWELIIQDDQNKLYLIKSNGEILWKKQLEESILGKVHQIDVYKNNKLQLTFNTASKVYQIDRNGDDVDSFPIELNDEAQIGMSIFDYDKNRNYRLVIPTKHSLKMLDAKGNKIKGWKGSNIRPQIITSPVHFAINNKDYILSCTETSEVLILDRKGEKRINLKEKFFVDQHTQINLIEEGKTPYFQFIDTTGVKVQINLKGKVSKEEMIPKEGRFIGTIDSKEFYVEDFEIQAKELDYNFDLDQQSAFEIQSIKKGTASFVALCINNSHKVYLTNSTGETLSGFPIYGNTGLFIDYLNDDYPSLIIGSKEGTLYNYSVQLTE